MHDLSPYEIGMLKTSMSEGSVAKIIGRSQQWVIQARSMLAGRPVQVQDAPAAAQPLAAESQPLTGLAAAIAEATPIGPYGSPAGLQGPALASWLYDNTDLTFAKIAAVSGATLAQVQAIADGEPVSLFAPSKAVAKINTGGRTIRPDSPSPEHERFPEIPARIIRWARWFIEAEWSYPSVAALFDVPVDALRFKIAEAKAARP